MQTYYKTITKIYDNCKSIISSTPIPVEAESKPADMCDEGESCDTYTDFFDTYTEALQFIKKSR